LHVVCEVRYVWRGGSVVMDAGIIIPAMFGKCP